MDEAALEEYLRGNSPVSQQYRALPDDLPPPALDRQVLAQARAALGEQAVVGRPRWVRWGAPMAVAASAVMALSIVMQGGLQEAEIAINTQMIDEASAPMAAPQSAAQAPAADAVPEADAASEDEATVLDFGAQSQPPLSSIARDDLSEQLSAQDQSIPLNDKANRSIVSREVPAEKAAETARVQSSPARVQSAQERARTSETSAEPASAANTDASVATQSAGHVILLPPDAVPPTPAVMAPSEPVSGATPQTAPSPARPMAAPAAAPAPPPSVMSAMPAEPEAWLSEIRRLRLDGEGAAADREWQRFRKVFPDYAVTDADPARPAQCRGSC